MIVIVYGGIDLPRKIILWGMGNEYENLLNNILFEIEKGNICVEGIVVRKEDIFCSYRDGFRIITKDEVVEIGAEFIVVVSDEWFDEIKNEALSIGFDPTKVIRGSVMKIPRFDFRKYFSLIDNPVSILSNNCWGGMIYRKLRLQFSTPLINIYWENEEFINFLRKPLFYLKSPLKMVYPGDMRRERPLIARLGTADDNVKIKMVHCTNFEDALKQWNRRMQRFNEDNLFVKLYIPGTLPKDTVDRYVSVFNELPYKKILLYTGNEENEVSFKSCRFLNRRGKEAFVVSYKYDNYFLYDYLMDVDVLSLLTGENYNRYS